MLGTVCRPTGAAYVSRALNRVLPLLRGGTHTTHAVATIVTAERQAIDGHLRRGQTHTEWRPDQK